MIELQIYLSVFAPYLIIVPPTHLIALDYVASRDLDQYVRLSPGRHDSEFAS